MTAPLYYTYPFAISGDHDTVPQVYPDNGQVSYQDGWTESYQLDLSDPDSGAIPISRTQTNQLFYDATSNIQQYQQQGTPNWYALDATSTAIPYPLYARVLYVDGNIYESQAAANIAVPGTDTSWLRVSGSTVLPGTIIDWAGATVPDGYLNCDGSSVSQATYSALYAAIGSLWGVAGVGLFLLPNLQGYVTAGSGVTIPPLPDNIVGTRGGADTHAITIAEMPNHAHGPLSNNGFVGGNTSTHSIQFASGTDGHSDSTTAFVGGGTPSTIVQKTAIVMKLIKT